MDENKKCVCFPALVNGMQLTCAISGESLAYRFTGDTPEQWLASFRQHRWDLEEEAENLIQEQSEDESRLGLVTLIQIFVLPFHVIIRGIA